MTVIPQNGADVSSRPDASTQDGADAPPGSVTISPFYHSSVNEITQPNSYTACSHYLTRRWKRELGPTGYAILTSFRDRCFFNRKTGELRDVIQVAIPEIAEECGVSDKTVRREMAGNKALQRFIRAQREPVPDARRGGWRWGPSTFQVAMDDPIHPDDEQELLEIVRRKAIEADKAPEAPLVRARRLAALGQAVTSGQNDRAQKAGAKQRSDNLTERKDRLSTSLDRMTGQPGQIDRTLKSPDSSLPEKTLLTPAAPGDLLSLFPEGESDRTTPSAEELRAVPAALIMPPEAPKAPKVAEIQAEWDAMTPEARGAFRPEAVRQLQEAGCPSPPERVVEPTMFKLFWAQRKGLGLAAPSLKGMDNNNG